MHTRAPHHRAAHPAQLAPPPRATLDHVHAWSCAEQLSLAMAPNQRAGRVGVAPWPSTRCVPPTPLATLPRTSPPDPLHCAYCRVACSSIVARRVWCRSCAIRVQVASNTGADDVMDDVMGVGADGAGVGDGSIRAEHVRTQASHVRLLSAGV